MTIPRASSGTRQPRLVRTWAALLLLVSCSAAPAAVRGVGAIGLTVADLNRELTFFTNTLAFDFLGLSKASGPLTGPAGTPFIEGSPLCRGRAAYLDFQFDRSPKRW